MGKPVQQSFYVQKGVMKPDILTGIITQNYEMSHFTPSVAVINEKTAQK